MNGIVGYTPLGGTGLGTPFPAELDVFVVAAIVVAIALVLAAGRGAADPARLRPAARYLGAMVLLTLFVTLFAGFSAVYSVTDLVVDHHARYKETQDYYTGEEFSAGPFGGGVDLPIAATPYDFSSEPNNDANWSAAISSALVAITAGAVCAFHWRARRRLDPEVLDPVFRTAGLGVCFVTGLTLAVSVVGLAFGVFEIIAPGISIGGVHKVAQASGVSEAIAFGFLAVATSVLFGMSWRRAFPRAPRSAEPTASGADLQGAGGTGSGA